MKLLKDYTIDELAALTDEQANALAELEVAERGLPYAAKPEEVVVKAEYIEPALTAYQVGSLLFVNEADALAAAKAPQYKEANLHYDWQNKFAELDEEPPKVVRGLWYSRSQAIERKAAISDTKARKADYEAAAKAYEEYATGVQRVKDEVWSAIYEAQRQVARIKNAKAQHERFLQMAGGDAVIAKRFFVNAFKGQDDLLEAVLGWGWNVEAASATVAPVSTPVEA